MKANRENVVKLVEMKYPDIGRGPLCIEPLRVGFLDWWIKASAGTRVWVASRRLGAADHVYFVLRFRKNGRWSFVNPAFVPGLGYLGY